MRLGLLTLAAFNILGLRTSGFGRLLFALGDHSEAARLSGASARGRC